MTWMDDARCLGADPDLFVPSGRGSADGVYAYRICFDCPVLNDCLDHALSVNPTSDVGVWGGTSQRQRNEIRRGDATVDQAWADNRRRVNHLTDTPPTFNEPAPKPKTETCSVLSCPRETRARGWCEPHYRRWKKHGDVYADVPIEHNGGLPLSERQREAS